MYKNKTITRSVGYIENLKRNNQLKALNLKQSANLIKLIGQIIKKHFSI